MTQEQLDLLVRLMREVVRHEFRTSQIRRDEFEHRVEETYAYQQCVRHLVKAEP